MCEREEGITKGGQKGQRQGMKEIRRKKKYESARKMEMKVMNGEEGLKGLVNIDKTAICA